MCVLWCRWQWCRSNSAWEAESSAINSPSTPRDSSKECPHGYYDVHNICCLRALYEIFIVRETVTDDLMKHIVLIYSCGGSFRKTSLTLCPFIWFNPRFVCYILIELIIKKKKKAELAEEKKKVSLSGNESCISIFFLSYNHRLLCRVFVPAPHFSNGTRWCRRRDILFQSPSLSIFFLFSWTRFCFW